MGASPSRAPHDYTPALGARWLTPFYDFAIDGFTREGRWRGEVRRLLEPTGEDRILDIGCGTGSLAIALARDADVVGIDPDPAVLARARDKAARAGVAPCFIEGFAGPGDLPAGWRPTKIVSTLVLHQTPLDEKRRIIKTAYALLPPGGVFVLADYGRQPGPLQRGLFRVLVQMVDGVDDTQPNADGVLETLLAESGFAENTPQIVIPTPTGAISLWRSIRPETEEAIAAIAAACASLIAAAQADAADQKAAPDAAGVLAAVDAFFLAYGAGDADAMAALLTEDAARIVVAPDRDPKITRGELQGILDFMRAPDFPKVRERYWNPSVLQRGDLAVAWTPYVLEVDGERRHCGVNVFNMTKRAGAWRIDAIHYTVEPDACAQMIPPDAEFRPDYSSIDETTTPRGE